MAAWENERKRRMDKIIELLEENPHGLTIQTIAKETRMVQEITKQRILQYIEELEWSGLLIKGADGRIRMRKR